MGRDRLIQEEQIFATIKEVDESGSKLTTGGIRRLIGGGDYTRIETCLITYLARKEEMKEVQKDASLRALSDEMRNLLEATSSALILRLEQDFISINQLAESEASVRVDKIKAKIETLTQEFEDEKTDLTDIIKQFDTERDEFYDKLTKSEEQVASLQNRLDNTDKKLEELFERGLKQFTDSQLTPIVREIKDYLNTNNIEKQERTGK